MNELQVFQNDQFGQVRTVQKDGEPWFVAADVCNTFGEKNRNRAMQGLDEDEKGYTQIDTPGGTQKMAIVNEPGLYALLFAMQPQKARGVSDDYIENRMNQLKAFKRWITHEVIPSIRKSGGYIAGQENMTDAELLSKALLVAHRQIEARDAQIEVMTPKALFADAVSASKTSILIGDLAKLLKQNGCDIGQKRIFAWLRDNGYLIRQKGASYNTPTQRSMDMKLFDVKETTITHADGHIAINRTTKVTGKGHQYFINKFLKHVEN